MICYAGRRESATDLRGESDLKLLRALIQVSVETVVYRCCGFIVGVLDKRGYEEEDGGFNERTKKIKNKAAAFVSWLYFFRSFTLGVAKFMW